MSQGEQLGELLTLTERTVTSAIDMREVLQDSVEQVVISISARGVNWHHGPQRTGQIVCYYGLQQGRIEHIAARVRATELTERQTDSLLQPLEEAVLRLDEIRLNPDRRAAMDELGIFRERVLILRRDGVLSREAIDWAGTASEEITESLRRFWHPGGLPLQIETVIDRIPELVVDTIIEQDEAERLVNILDDARNSILAQDDRRGIQGIMAFVRRAGDVREEIAQNIRGEGREALGYVYGVTAEGWLNRLGHWTDEARWWISDIRARVG